jgi:tetratricopeptide (TPR) repeat protein
MSFDKTSAMRNAERFLAQGKIALAIAEFRQVVTNDPRDHSTLNMLGDLYIKNGDPNQAVECYRTVAEHYGHQGFSQKAIAVYNKIGKIKPNSPDVIARLAALYKEKGSITEARTHYEQLAAYHERAGNKLEELETWQHIAELDPNNAAAFLTIGERFRSEGFVENAGGAFAEAGKCFAKRAEHEDAFSAYQAALDCGSVAVRMDFINSAFESGNGVTAVERIAAMREEEKHDRDLHSLLVDCYVRSGDLAAAETCLVELIELEPANYPKLLELSRLYLAASDASAAARVLSMSSEHLLIDGKAEELRDLVRDVLVYDSQHVDALRMMVRCSSWLKDDAGFREALYQLKDAAFERGSLDDEQWALSQIVMMAPHETAMAERLRELNLELGIEDESMGEGLFDKRFAIRSSASVDPGFEIAGVEITDMAAVLGTNGGGEMPSAIFDVEAVGETQYLDGGESDDPLQREIDSIRFYIASGYNEIAEKAIAELQSLHGDIAEIKQLTAELTGGDVIVVESPPAATVSQATISVGADMANAGATSGSFDLNDLRSELGLDEASEEDLSGDYETHYNTAIAYQEMHLLQEAIKEFQQAISIVEPNDGTRRFFQCANMLGHCFMQLGKANLAVRWFLRTLETVDISDDERMGIWYELALAYDADRDHANASRYFEQVYAENINFRDVAERVNSMVAAG